MSFSKDAKMQILKVPLKSKECKLAFMSGLLHASGEFDVVNKTMSYITDILDLYDFTNTIISELYGTSTELSIEEDMKIHKTRYFRITLPKEKTFQMLSDFGMINAEGEFLYNTIDENLFKDEESKKSFIKGVFLGCATSSIRISEKETEKTSSGYDIEFVSHSHKFLLELSSILTDFGIFPKIVQRKKHFVLYVKDSAKVSDLLAIVEAFDSVLTLQNELALREIRNKVNRQTNCLNANISKTVDASLKQVEAIQLISDTIGLESLPLELQEVALLRLANPEESLSELLKLSNIDLTKSGLNHRIKKILKIADNLKS